MTSDHEEPMIVSLMRRTPTGEVRYIAKPGERGMIGTSTHGFLSELDAWLSSVRREAATEALTEAARAIAESNPQMNYENRHARFDKIIPDWLRARAAEIQEGRN